jgi:hypothetical protein
MWWHWKKKKIIENAHLKFHENPSNGSRVVPYGRVGRDMTKQMVAFHNFANVSKNVDRVCL